MNKKLFQYEIAGFIFVCILGTLAHFIFDWSAQNAYIGTFSPVNESVWEHLKMLFFPYLIWSIGEYFLLKKPENLFLSKLIGIIAGMLITVFIYYTYTGATGSESMIMDIFSFIVGVGAAFIISYAMMKNGRNKSKPTEIISAMLLLAVAAVFIIFTFSPPMIPLFEDPKSFTYGI